jgi:hypothetical protein
MEARRFKGDSPDYLTPQIAHSADYAVLPVREKEMAVSLGINVSRR